MLRSCLVVYLLLLGLVAHAQDLCDEGSDIVKRCCELENEIRQLANDLNSVREGDPQSPQFAELKKQYDRLSGEKVLLQGIKDLADNFNSLRERLIDPRQYPSPVNHFTRAIQEETNTLKKIQAIHHAFEELNINEELRNAQNPDQLQTALRNRCTQPSLPISATHLCEGLNLRAGATIEGFENGEQFLGSFLEAYVFAASGSGSDEERVEHINRYQALLNDTANEPLVTLLLDSATQSSAAIDRALSAFSSAQLDQHTRLGSRALTECLEAVRYSQDTRVDSRICEPKLVELEQVIDQRRSAMLSTIGAQNIVEQLIHRSINESPELKTAQTRARAQIQQATQELALGSEDHQILSTMINRYVEALTEHARTSLSELPTDQVMQAFFTPERSESEQQVNLAALKRQSQDILNSLGCSDPQTQFLEQNAQGELSVSTEKLHECFKTNGADTEEVQQRISSIDNQQAQMQEQMRAITRRPDYVQGQSLLNFLAHKSATECPGRTETSLVQTCFHPDHSGDVQIRNLLSQGELITSYYIDAYRPNEQTAIEATRMQEFCVQNRTRYPIGCPEATRIYRDVTEDRDQINEDYREYFRTTSTSVDPRTGAVTRRPRVSTGSMVANGLATSLVKNIGWGFGYWQTNQMLPGMQAQAFQMKTAQAWQNQQWLYFQQAYYNPGFGGFGGLGVIPSAPRAPITNGIQTISI